MGALYTNAWFEFEVSIFIVSGDRPLSLDQWKQFTPSNTYVVSRSARDDYKSRAAPSLTPFFALSLKENRPVR